MLEARKISKIFNKVYALRQASLSVVPGEVLGLVGESGSGKSTMAKILTRILEQTEGEVCLDGRSVPLAGEALRQFRNKVQIVFQSPYASFDPRMTLGESMAEAMRYGGERNKRAIADKTKALFETVHLDVRFASHLPHEISGGECQRAAIARALSRDPKYLICDEVISSLDPIAQAKILNLFLQLQKQRGLGLIFIAHDLRSVRHLCDRVTVLKEGEVCEEAKASQLFASPQHAYTRDLMASAGLLDKA